ncbi:MAG: hypothetical protein ACFFDS_03545 [Candidatus Thorarchaeota archaeon]
MDNIEKLALEAFERGKKDSYIPQDPFISFGFENNPFLETPIEDLKKQTFLQPRIRKISHYIGKVFSSHSENFKKKKPNDDNPVLDGVLYYSSQTGATTLIELTYQLLKDHYNLSFIDAKKLVVFENNQYSITKTIQNFRNLLGDLEIGIESLSVVIIDHSDFLIDFFEEFRSAFERDFQDVSLVYIFSHSGWTRLKSNLALSNYDLFNKIIQSVLIDPLSVDEIKEILRIKLSIDGKIQKPYTGSVISQVTEISGGSINNAIKICVRLCEECFYNGLDTASRHLVNDIASILGISSNKEFYNLVTLRDNTQTRILSLISMKSIAFDYGITYEEVVLNSDIKAKTSATHHLKQLQEKKFITKKTVNRKAFYRLRDELRTLSDTYLLPSFEQEEMYVQLESIADLF